MSNVMAAQPNIGGTLCESSVIPFLVPRHKVWLTAAARVQCKNAGNIGRRCSKEAKMRSPLKFAGVPQTPEPISTVSAPQTCILNSH